MVFTTGWQRSTNLLQGIIVKLQVEWGWRITHGITQFPRMSMAFILDFFVKMWRRETCRPEW